ncbi:MAG: hypothetical protein K6E30_08870, partial [Lachnospiraceae bacterium]|nr:hypothetical protein [Lachnospiraceae bacterium]
AGSYPSVHESNKQKNEAQRCFQVLGINAPIGGKQFGLIQRIQLEKKEINRTLQPYKSIIPQLGFPPARLIRQYAPPW